MRVTKNMITEALLYTLKENAPVRGENMPGGYLEKHKDYLKPNKSSPYPGNLKNNLIESNYKTSGVSINVKGYGPYTEKTSFKKGWMQKSVREFLQKLQNWGGVIK